MKNKLRLFFIFWWFAAVIMPFVGRHYDFLYDAAGVEGSFWWLTFLISFPFGISGEFVGEALSDYSENIQLTVSFILGSLFIFLIYFSVSQIRKRRGKNS